MIDPVKFRRIRSKIHWIAWSKLSLKMRFQLLREGPDQEVLEIPVNDMLYEQVAEHNLLAKSHRSRK